MIEPSRQLVLGVPVEGRLEGKNADVFDVHLETGQFVHLVAEQLGLDVKLRLFNPGHQLLTEVDSPIGSRGAEEVTLVAAASGLYRVEVSAGDAKPGGGTYRLRIESLRAATEADRRTATAEHMFNSAEVLRRGGQTQQALLDYRLACREWEALGDRPRQATCHYRMGWMEHALEKPPHLEEADRHFQAALDLLGETDPSLQATIWNRRGRVLLALGRVDPARAAHERALALFRNLGDRDGEAEALQNLGMVESRGDAALAKQHFVSAVALWQQLGNIKEEKYTRSSLARLPRHTGMPAAPSSAALPGSGAPLAVQDVAERHDAAFAPILDAGTLVLRYELGDEHGTLWTATAAGPLGQHPLPGRAAVEAVASRLFAAVQQDGAQAQAEWQAAATDLSRMLLAPAAAHLMERRLVVVVDGWLERVPFALLPEPRPAAGEPAQEAAQPLLERHEIVYLAAATAAAVLDGPSRRQGGLREPGPAVVGAPVLRADDPRLAGTAAGGTAGRPELPADLVAALAGVGLEELPALPFSLAEAEAIVELMPQLAPVHALGLDANLDLLRGTALRGFRILHLAVLAVLAKAGSGLVVSCFDASGRPRPGFLRLADLARLNLPADLLVVTGSRLSGEAGVGGLELVGAAMQAGAAKVVTSLWSVEDQSAVELMKHFYKGLRQGALEPAALRQAQLAVAADARWHAPRHWAGFLFSGDWRQGRRGHRPGGGTIEADDKGGTGSSGPQGNDMPPPDEDVSYDEGSGQ